MGPLTESMTRLCGEIVGLRGARQAFVKGLSQDVATMKAHFRQSHAAMARKTKRERQGFIKALGHEVASLRASFRRAHADMARKSKAGRRAAVSHLKHLVAGMRHEFALDLAGAHRAWFGPSAAERRAKIEAERRAKIEAERRAKEEAERRAKEEAERQRLAAAAKPKEMAVRQLPVQSKKEAAARLGPGKKKG